MSCLRIEPTYREKQFWDGRPESGYVIERMVDLAADQLGIDPAELRRRNTIPPSALPFKTSVTFTYDSGEFEKNMDLALKAADWKGFEARRARARKNGKLRGLGFSNTIERSASAGLEGAEIRFDRTGSVSMFSGSINQGQGHETAFKQIVCDRLGLDPNEVTYIQGDTDQVFFAEGTGGSRSAAFSGSAFTLAADKVETKAKAIAAHMLKVEVGDIKFADGVFSSQKTNQTLTIKEVAKASLEPKNLPQGMEPGLIEKAIYTGHVASYPNGVHVCELEIDEETGVVTLARAGQFVYVQTKERGFRVNTRSGDVFTPGDVVEATGFVTPTNNFAVMNDALLRKTGRTAVPEWEF